MANQPVFHAVSRTGVANFASANTARDGSGTINDVLVGAASPGTQVLRVVVKAEDDLADGIVLLWLHNGTSWFLFDEIDTGDGANADNTTPGYRFERRYDDLFLPSASWKLGATITVAPTAGDVNVFAFGADLA